ncbi:MAG: epimerase [Ignavibacteriales bacterium]|nr:epimerase [Ignavibacteriales bacterium]
MKIKAIIFGATGMVGEGVLLQAIQNPDVESVLVIGRRSCEIKHNKLMELIHNNFYNYTNIEYSLAGYNACFFCLGVSSVGKNEVEYNRITFELTMQAATTLSKLNPEMTFCYISGLGTDSTEAGRVMWARVKGKTENQLKTLPFKAVYLFRPGFIKPIEGQRNIKSYYKVLGYVYPLLKIVFPNLGCKLEDVGNAMIQVSKDGYSKQILENKDIDQIARSRKSDA